MQTTNLASRFGGVLALLARRGPSVGLVAAVLTVVVGAASLALGASGFGYLVLVLGLGMGAGWAATFALYRLTVVQPLVKLTRETVAPAQLDTATLSDTLAALAEGDLTRKVAWQSRSVAVSSSSEVNRLSTGIADIIARLTEGASRLNSMTDEACQRLLFVGADGYLQGQTCAEAMGRALNGRGQVLVVTFQFRHAGLELRRKGFEGMLHEKYPGIEILPAIEAPYDPAGQREAILPLLKKYPRLAGIYSTVAAAGTAWAVSDMGLAGKVTVLCHDLTEDVAPWVQKGVITGSIGQDPFAQGHDPVIHLFNNLVAGWQPPDSRLLTAMDMVSAANVNQFWQNGLGIVESEAMAARRPKPMKASPHRVRILVLGMAENKFWDPVHGGVLAAAEELRKFNGEVEWLVPEGTGPFDVPTRSEAIEAALKQNWDAMATPIMDTALVESLNRVIQAGIPVATFNSEPSSLRGLMTHLSHRAEKLLTVSSHLAQTAEHSGESTHQIADNVSQMAAAVTNEATAMTRANASLERIAESVEAIASGAAEQGKAAERLSQAANHISVAVKAAGSSSETVVASTIQAVTTAERGSEAIRQTLQQMESIERAVESSASTIQETNSRAQQIGEIVGTIEDIAAQTNLLALNAAIEAARAGEQGKGFAVVASEVRKLAEKSAAATKEISAIIATVQETARRAAEAMDVAMRKVHDGSSLAQHSGQALDELLESAKTTHRQTGEVASANQAVAAVMDDLTTAIDRVSAVISDNIDKSELAAAGIRETLEIVESVAAISEENAASAERVAVTTSEVSAQAKDVNEAAAALTGIARELEGSTASFKLSRKDAEEAAQLADAGPEKLESSTARKKAA
jgi:methyl-accepting chemotaxis protein